MDRGEEGGTDEWVVFEVDVEPEADVEATLDDEGPDGLLEGGAAKRLGFWGEPGPPPPKGEGAPPSPPPPPASGGGALRAPIQKTTMSISMQRRPEK